MPLHIEFVSGDEMTTAAGQPFPFELVVQVREDGRPAVDKTVVFTADPPNSILFGGDIYAASQTNAQGLARARPFGHMPGQHVILASLPGADEDNKHLQASCLITVTEPDVEVQTMPNGQVVLVPRRRSASAHRSHFGWPHAAVALGALALAAAAILGALGAFEKTPIVYPPPLPPQPPTPVVAGTVDTQAREGIVRVEGKVDTLGVKLGEHADQEAEARGTGDFALAQRIQEDESIRNKLFQRALAAGYGPRRTAAPSRSRWRVAFYPSP